MRALRKKISTGIILDTAPARAGLLHAIVALCVAAISVLPWDVAYAAGNATTGSSSWSANCTSCHASPNINGTWTTPTAGYSPNAHPLSWYADDATGARVSGSVGDGTTTTSGYAIAGNATYSNTAAGMSAYSATLGTAGAPTQTAADIAAYFASLFAVPGQPGSVSATGGNGQASVSFAAPASTLTITTYTVTSSGGQTASGTGSPITVTGLTNGTAYTFTVTATSNAGTGSASAVSNSVTPATVPGAPTIGTATGGNAQASVTFTAPFTNGGAAITGYTVTSSGGQTATGTGSPITVTGLTNGTAYTFTVKATNSVGTGAASGSSNSVTPATVPGAPTIGTATGGNTQASVTFTAPASNGGAAITGYTVTSSGGQTATGTGSPITVTGLTNGTAYTFTVKATNSVGTGAASGASNSVTPATVPGAPTIGTATAVGSGQVQVTFSAPASNGGAVISGYTVTSSGGQTASGTGSPITVSGLTNGTAYTFTVTATNSVGTGAASTASNSATPVTVPGAPTINSVTSGNAQVTVDFSPPASTGGATITSYTVTSSGGQTATGTASPLTVTGLTNGTAYTFTVTATTSAGTGSASASSNSVIPATVPGAPTIGTATGGNGQASVTFAAPASNGGAAITSYTVISSGGQSATGTASPITVSGLSNGTAYTFTVTATNSVGTGTASAVSNSVVPATVPGAPTIGTATGGNGQASVTFAAPASNGGAAITSYTVTSSGGQTASGAASPLTVTGLTNGTAYTFTITATNSAGTSVASSASNSVTPVTVPGAPSISSVIAGNAQATVIITPPASNGGTAITGYTVSSSPAGGVDSNAGSTTLNHVITGLTNHTPYTFTVIATNSVGSSATSAASGSVTPEAPPTASASSAAVAYNSTANVITPTIAGTVNTAGITVTVAALHGTATASATNNTVVYTPTTGYFGADSFTFTITGPGGTSSPAVVSITVGNPPPPTVSNAAMSLTLNTSQTLDLAPYIGGVGITGVNISASPLHGAVAVAGTRVTYTPNKDYFGTDSFSYKAYGAAGQVSATAATVTVTITGRPDPLKDARVTGLVNVQTTAVKRFGTAQVFNFQQRLESRHHAMYAPLPLGAPGDASNTPAPVGGALPPQGANYFNSWQPGTALAYANNPDTLLHTASTGGGNAVTTPTIGNVMGLVANALTSSTLNLGAISSIVGASADETFNRLEFWAAGSLRFGSRSQSGVDTQFTTDGISVGVDKRLDRKLTAGMGMGYARDKSNIGTDGTNSSSSGNSVAGYASYQMDNGTFLDGLLGYGKVSFDTNRYVAAVNDFARATRSGDQLFGSVSFGYEYRKDAVMWSPYGRFDFSLNRLDAGTESGAGANALSYASQNTRTSHLSFGVRAQAAHQTSFGVAQPHVRFEYQHGMEANSQTAVAYADLPGVLYAVPGTSQNTNAAVLGLGSDFLLSDTLRVALDYQRLRSNGFENYQSISFRLTKDINGKNDLDTLLEDSYESSIEHPSGLVIATGFAYDDNVSRASASADRLSDSIFSLTLSKAKSLPLSLHTRLALSGFMDVEKFRDHAGLGHLSGGMQGEYMYRPSGEYGSPTYGVFARYTADQYESALRDGSHHSIGITLRDPLTDRISLFAALAENTRSGNSAVFNTHDVSGRANLDYALAAGQTLYLTGEYRKGDIVSSGRPSLAILDTAKVFIRDDAFAAQGFFAYRMPGQTTLLTCGYNHSFGAKDSLDLVWRHAQAAPDSTPAYAAPLRYIDNLYSITYLMAF